MRIRCENRQKIHALRPVRRETHVPRQIRCCYARPPPQGDKGRSWLLFFRTATQAVDKANQYATRDRKTKKRNFRALWIQRINAAVRLFDAEFTYSRLIDGLNKAGIEVDRKVLAELAVNEPEAFNAIAAQAQAALA